jgi:hypothetical protein
VVPRTAARKLARAIEDAGFVPRLVDNPRAQGIALGLVGQVGQDALERSGKIHGGNNGASKSQTSPALDRTGLLP